MKKLLHFVFIIITTLYSGSLLAQESLTITTWNIETLGGGLAGQLVVPPNQTRKQEILLPFSCKVFTKNNLSDNLKSKLLI